MTSGWARIADWWRRPEEIIREGTRAKALVDEKRGAVDRNLELATKLLGAKEA